MRGLFFLHLMVQRTNNWIKACVATPERLLSIWNQRKASWWYFNKRSRDFSGNVGIFGVSKRLFFKKINYIHIISIIRLKYSLNRSEAIISNDIDDTYKQLKSTSDFMKYIIVKYKLESLKTLMKIQIPCVSVIEKCLTLCLTSIHDKSK